MAIPQAIRIAMAAQPSSNVNSICNPVKIQDLIMYCHISCPMGPVSRASNESELFKSRVQASFRILFCYSKAKLPAALNQYISTGTRS